MAVTWKKVLLEGDAATASDVAPSSIGTAAAAGTGVNCSRDDHVHDIGADAIDSGDLIADDVINSEHYAAASIDTEHIAADQITSALIADDAVGSEHIEQLSAALDFGGQQAQDVVIHTVADAAGMAGLTPVVGKLCWRTDTLSPYVCTASV